jgi:hypothetical protein
MLDPQISQIIQQNAARLIGQDGITRHDAEAIRQELTAHVIQKLDSFDPQLGELTAFAAAVVRRRMISILRSRRAGKRDHRRITSLNVEIAVPGEAPTELANTISDRELDGRLHRHRRTDHEIRALATDMVIRNGHLSRDWSPKKGWLRPTCAACRVRGGGSSAEKSTRRSTNPTSSLSSSRR